MHHDLLESESANVGYHHVIYYRGRGAADIYVVHLSWYLSLQASPKSTALPGCRLFFVATSNTYLVGSLQVLKEWSKIYIFLAPAHSRISGLKPIPIGGSCVGDLGRSRLGETVGHGGPLPGEAVIFGGCFPDPCAV